MSGGPDLVGPGPGRADLLGPGDGPARRRLPRGLLLGLAALVAVLVVGDGAVRRHEAGVLLDRVAAASSAVQYADRRVAGTVQYASGQLGSSTSPAGVQADLRRLVQGEAAGQVAPVRARRDAVAGVRVLPWHRDVRTARAACTAAVDARLAQLTAASRDLAALYVRPPALQSTAQAARARLTAVVPAGQHERVQGLLVS